VSRRVRSPVISRSTEQIRSRDRVIKNMAGVLLEIILFFLFSNFIFKKNNLGTKIKSKTVI